jgi:hypothetical protein
MKFKSLCGVVLVLLCATVAIAKDKTEYQVGTFIPVHNTSAFSVHMYAIRVDGGIWMIQPVNDKPTPLDDLDDGDKVMFRVPDGRDPVGKLHMYIPNADNPKKEAEFVANWLPQIPPPAPEPKPTESKKRPDNVAAMCASGRLSPEQQQKFCSTSK